MKVPLLLLTLSLLMLPGFAQTYDLVITGGRVIDPETSFDQTANVGISGDSIAIITTSPITGSKIIDAAGLVVSPGFIDILADNHINPHQTWLTVERYKLYDGVTTVLQMHGGTHNATGTFNAFQKKRHLTNYGWSTLVSGVLWSKKTIPEREKLIRWNLERGTLGVSHAIEYVPIPYKEMLAYAKIAAEYRVPVYLHLRYSDFEREVEGVQEAIDLARDSGASVHIDHLSSTGATWHMPQVLKMIDDANREGLDVHVCVYPYSYWATYTNSRRFGPGWQERYNITCNDLRILGSGERLTESLFRKLRKKTGVIVAVPEGTMPLETVYFPVLEYPWSCVASDGGIETEDVANNHPRGAGTFSRAIRLGLDRGWSLVKCLANVTSKPAKFVPCKAMERRGRLRKGMIADITVFDPEEIRDTATVEDPSSYSKGIRTVVVAGKITLADGDIQGYHGRIIKRTPDENP